MIENRQRELLQIIWRGGPLSRSQLREQTGIRLNTIGELTGDLLERGILREVETGDASRGRGRPPVPLEIDTDRRHVLGVVLLRNEVKIGRINLVGEPTSPTVSQAVGDYDSLIGRTAELLRDEIDEDTLAIGMTTPGLIDAENHKILISPWLHNTEAGNLEPIFDAAGDVPLAIDNDAHGLAAHWGLLHAKHIATDTLLVLLGDGQLGSSLLIDGKPNTGSVNGANELGHTRMPIETPPCYCGHIGCLERVVSSEFLGRSIDKALTNFDASDGKASKMLDLLAMGLGNAINFTRISRLILVSSWMRHQPFADALTTRTQSYVLEQLAQRLTIESWDRPAAEPATTAGCLALAHLYSDKWDSLLTSPETLTA